MRDLGSKEYRMSFWTDVMQGIPINAVLKERLALAEQKFKDIEAENKGLQQQVATLRQQNEQLSARVHAYEANETAAESKPNLERDFYRFEGDPGLFCTTCYDMHAKKVCTTVVLAGVRTCPVCKTVYGH